MQNLVDLPVEEGRGGDEGRDDEGNDTDGVAIPPYICIICRSTAREPCVNFCGHLFCRPCIYEWMYRRGVNAKCPICQACVGENTLIPISYDGGPMYPTCMSLAEQRRKFCMKKISVPLASIFNRGFVRIIPEPFPRLQPLAPELLREAPQASVVRYFVDHSVFRRFAIMAIMLFLLLFSIHSSGSN